MGQAPANIRNEFRVHQFLALDLQVPANYFEQYLRIRDPIAYLDVNNTLYDPRIFDEVYYLALLENNLVSFLSQFELVLLGLLTTHLKIEYNGDFFELLLETHDSEFNENMIFRYLRAFTVTRRFEVEHLAVRLFDNMSSVLYERQYTNPRLAATLLKAVCFEGRLPISAQLVSPAEKLDYVLFKTKYFTTSVQPSEIFRQFRRVNSITPCLRAGRIDVLQVMLRYGSWKEFTEYDAVDWILYCFGEMNVNNVWVMVDYLRARRYSLRRYILVLQLYYVLSVANRTRARYVSAIKFFWSSIPDAYFTTREIYSMICRIANARRTEIIRICKIYHRNLNSNQSQPRSLMHYTRCAVRSALELNNSLPEGIELLDVPQKFRLYLKLVP